MKRICLSTVYFLSTLLPALLFCPMTGQAIFAEFPETDCHRCCDEGSKPEHPSTGKNCCISIAPLEGQTNGRDLVSHVEIVDASLPPEAPKIPLPVSVSHRRHPDAERYIKVSTNFYSWARGPPVTV